MRLCRDTHQLPGVLTPFRRKNKGSLQHLIKQGAGSSLYKDTGWEPGKSGLSQARQGIYSKRHLSYYQPKNTHGRDKEGGAELEPIPS